MFYFLAAVGLTRPDSTCQAHSREEVEQSTPSGPSSGVASTGTWWGVPPRCSGVRRFYFLLTSALDPSTDAKSESTALGVPIGVWSDSSGTDTRGARFGQRVEHDEFAVKFRRNIGPE